MDKIIAWDIETLNPVDGVTYTFEDHAELLGISIACTFSPMDGFMDWVGIEAKDLWEYLKTADRLISWNGIKFDSRVLHGQMFLNDRATTSIKPSCWKGKLDFLQIGLGFRGKMMDMILDLYEATGQYIGLDNVSKNTLSEEKEMKGVSAPEEWDSGHKLEVITYCRGDVKKTFSLYRLVEAGKEIRYWDYESKTVKSIIVTPKVR